MERRLRRERSSIGRISTEKSIKKQSRLSLSAVSSNLESNTLAFFMALAKLHGGDAKAIIRAHNDYRKLKSRYTCQPTVNLLKSFPGTERNIVIDYYLRGKRLF